MFEFFFFKLQTILLENNNKSISYKIDQYSFFGYGSKILF